MVSPLVSFSPFFFKSGKSRIRHASFDPKEKKRSVYLKKSEKLLDMTRFPPKKKKYLPPWIFFLFAFLGQLGHRRRDLEPKKEGEKENLEIFLPKKFFRNIISRISVRERKLCTRHLTNLREMPVCLNRSIFVGKLGLHHPYSLTFG